MDAEQLSIQGSVERVTYHSEETGYCVLRVKIKGHRELVTVTGLLSSVSAGESVEAQGAWTQHKEFGVQFKSQSLRTLAPATLEGMERYLGSGLVKGIGPQFAKRLVTVFGTDVFQVIEEEPERLRLVPGIGPKRVERILEAWNDQKVIREIMVFLQSHGISTGKAVRIFKTYGQDSVEKVKSNPYRLARDIYGIGFKSADAIAEKMGIARDSLIRAQAGLHYVLAEQVGRGHCCYPRESLLTEAETSLEIPREKLNEALASELQQGFLVEKEVEGTCVLFPTYLHRWEQEAAQGFRELANGTPPWGQLQVEAALGWVQQWLGLELATLQKEAVRQALHAKVTVITGGPGTGKTTLTKAILQILRAKGLRLLLCSPTGRAAKRLSECTGLEAKTIHRLLKWNAKLGEFDHGPAHPLEADLVLLDEASMVDLKLFHGLVRAIPKRAALILLGDVDQLPSVGSGNILQDIISSQTVPVVKLKEIFRQAAQSEIIQAAHRMNEGMLPNLVPRSGSDFFFLPAENPEEVAQNIVDLVKTRLPRKYGFNSIHDIQVLCPMQRGSLGARNLNLSLQKELNPNPTTKVERFGYRFSPGDKVMVLVNDYDKEVFNGDIGYVQDLDLEEQECTIDFEGRLVVFDFGELDILAPAYTITIHKSQGSEYPAVVIPVHMQHFMMLKRNLIYTGVTRGKKLVVLIGQKKALAIAIKANGDEKRWSNLRHVLVE